MGLANNKLLKTPKRRNGSRNAHGAGASVPRTYTPGTRNIVLTAERLFGRYGLSGVSMRQILIASGQANKSAIYHHFGGMEGLIQAVFDMRAGPIDEARGIRLRAYEEAGKVGLRELLEALLLPHVDVLEGNARQAYAQFILQLLEDEPVERWRERSQVSYEIQTRIRQELAHLPDEVFFPRFKLVIELFMSGIARPMRVVGRRARGATAYEYDLIDMGVAAFSVPWPPVGRPDGAAPGTAGR
jgi:AcrR family transcriptional regulator